MTRYTTVRLGAGASSTSVTVDGWTDLALTHLMAHGYGDTPSLVCRAAVERAHSLLFEDGHVRSEGDAEALLDELSERFDLTRSAALSKAIVALWAQDKF